MTFRRKRWVFKLSGSLDNEKILSRLIPVIDELSSKLRVVIVPGGGAFADFIRARSARRKTSEKTAHAQAVMSTGQFGYELAERFKNGIAVYNRSQVTAAFKSGATPVFIPHPFAVDQKRIPATWEATSDTIAVETCRYLRIGGLVMLKSVDGIYKNGKLQAQAGKASLKKSGVVDPVFGGRLEPGWDVFILNGRKPQRLKQLLETGSTIMTKIRC
ncbi:hypothetical protein MNBD_NITROSPINAE03-2090 [hydrothermal vent metagenome]|uniref:Aspartate/glutamate/uridylate kinase domain-containing protein n=1 Tax=hydrothermal vent metagenome TaxID=652676 RepID=A0A3B1C7W2_9ZZZZ